MQTDIEVPAVCPACGVELYWKEALSYRREVQGPAGGVLVGDGTFRVLALDDFDWTGRYWVKCSACGEMLAFRGGED